MESSNGISPSDGPQVVQGSENASDNGSQETCPVKAPRRVLYFSDGDMEEYSTDEEQEVDKPDSTKAVHTGSENASDNGSQETRPVKAPRRVLYFSDGDMEEYSTDEEQEVDKPDPTKAVDTKKLSWPQYFLYATMAFGNGTVKACDYLGEGLASILGITTPKYQYEINVHKQMMKEQEEAKKKEDIEMSG